MNSQFTFHYPKDSGFDKTDIFFYKGEPKPESLFFSAEGSALVSTSKSPRLFVTDTIIINLPSMQEFKSLFKKELELEDSAYTATFGSDVLLVLGPGEPYKTLGSVTEILNAALSHNFNRNAAFVAIGGGVICDMTAFAASMFKRGVEVKFVPTTLLAMVDAAIGGKSGCDYRGFKNMIGAFWPATELHVWSQFVQTLSDEEYLSGLGEAVKTALLFSPELTKIFTEKKDLVLARDEETLSVIISECVQAKARIVEEDFREHGVRSFLNLGHTFGHALETVAGLGKISHGSAIMWGTGRALDLSVRLGLCTKDYAESSKKMMASYGYDMNPVPKVLSVQKKQYTQALLDAMRKDKKNESSEIRVILQRGNCDTLIQAVNDKEIEAVLQ
ncbi:MAG TPA: 3-dehydroquinate synthase [Treponema sp.]|nr:3-dehydroquinate synthase [Treponema sp.]